MSSAPATRLTTSQIVTLALISTASLVVALVPVANVKSGVMPALGIVVATVSLFATGALPAITTAAIFFTLSLASGLAPPLTLFSGFWSNAAMLIFSGLIIGAAAERSGLGRFVARGLMQRFVGSYPKLLLGVMIGTLALSFIIPSTVGRLAIAIPIVLAVAKEAGYAPGSNGYIAIVLTTVVGNFTTSFAILPANLVNVVVLGAGEGLYGPQLRYGEYLLLLGPVLGILKGMTFLAAMHYLLPAPPPTLSETEGPLPLSQAARRLAMVLALTVGLWTTDALHGLKPGWVALGAGALCLMPPVALVGLRECFDWNKLTAMIAMPTVLGVAALLTHSGAGRVIAEVIMAVVPLEGESPTYAFIAIALMSSLVSIIATIVGAIAIVTPLIGDVASATGLAPKYGLVAEITGLQAVFFHFEAVPIMVGLAMGRVAVPVATRLLVLLALSGLVVILPVQVGWLKLLGVL